MKLELTAAPIPIDENVDIDAPARAPLSVSGNGTVIYRNSVSPDGK